MAPTSASRLNMQAAAMPQWCDLDVVAWSGPVHLCTRPRRYRYNGAVRFSSDRFRVTQASASSLRRLVALSLVWSNCAKNHGSAQTRGPVPHRRTRRHRCRPLRLSSPHAGSTCRVKTPQPRGRGSAVPPSFVQDSPGQPVRCAPP